MQNHLLQRYLYFNCKKKGFIFFKEKVNILKAGIIFLKIIKLNCSTSTPMGLYQKVREKLFTETSGDHLGKHPCWSWNSFNLVQGSPCAHTHTHISVLSLCVVTYTQKYIFFYWPSLFLVVFKALHTCCILEIQLLTPAGFPLLSVLSRRLDYTPWGRKRLNYIVQQVKCFGLCIVSLRPIWESSKTYLNLAGCLN